MGLTAGSNKFNPRKQIYTRTAEVVMVPADPLPVSESETLTLSLFDERIEQEGMLDTSMGSVPAGRSDARRSVMDAM
jgi:hypothetical protein